MTVEHFDCLVVGAGISGIGAAYHMVQKLPDTSFVVLERQSTFGGTWETHKYPGIRSDSDLYTFGYAHKPWVGPPIATSEEIKAYMQEVIDDNGIAKHVRYNQHIDTASWDSKESKWTLEAHDLKTGEKKIFSGNFLWMCQGYYRHTKAYTPEWPGMSDYKGLLIHPQHWPTDLDYAGKEVIVIGSGATAATIVPAMADKAKHITMLQRSPTYFLIGKNQVEIADELRKLKIDETWIHEIVRRKISHDQAAFTKLCLEAPEQVKKDLIAGVAAHLPEGFDVEKHFTPSYRPWQQRIAFIPDGDMFKCFADGRASVETDHIERFTETGLLLKSGKELKGDIIVSATGFNLAMFGDIVFTVDGEVVDWHKTITYRGTMFTGVPNLIWVFGYFRASWTLRTDMISEFTCRLLQYMKDHGYRSVVPKLRDEDKDMKILPWIDEANFNPRYLLESMHLLPQRGEKKEWAHTQDYWSEKDEFPVIGFSGKEFVYAK